MKCKNLDLIKSITNIKTTTLKRTVRRCIPALNTHCLKNSTESGTECHTSCVPGSLCLECYVWDTP